MPALDETLARGDVRLSVDGPVATISLCAPDRRNAQTPHTWDALTAIGRELTGEVRAVVVRGDGPSFSAGLDLRMFTPEGVPDAISVLDIARMPDSDADAAIANFQSAFSWLRRNDIVSVAAVQGHAVGAGFQLALACDFRVCADDALFTMAETSRGLVPDLGGTGILVDLVGYMRALEICVTGRRVDAAEALRIGIATIVVPGAELDSAVSDLVAASLSPLRDAVTETKALLAAAGNRSTFDRLAAERSAQLRRLRDLAGVGE